jgi:hypothetical protein
MLILRLDVVEQAMQVIEYLYSNMNIFRRKKYLILYTFRPI